MDALDLLLTRESALKLEAPAPSEADLDTIFQSAVRAPDHGRLRPWRFVVIESGMRERFGELMAEALKRKNPDADAEMLSRERAKPMRAPLIVAAAARVQKGHRIPEVEQISAAAAATQNMMLAAHALGYGAMWKTGEPAYDAGVKTALGLNADDEIMGFLYLGTRNGAGSPAARPAARDQVTVWAG
ncbi:MAG: nitroreductase [Acetobacteraceae bacterium]|nr:nitroreductase [Acetobacteraceae bacterium]